MVTEEKLASMIKEGKVDEAALMCLRKPEAEVRETLPLDSAASNQFPVELEFNHDSRLFHQNALTKKNSVVSNAVTAVPAKPTPLTQKPIVQKIPASVKTTSKSKAATTVNGGKVNKSLGFTQQKVMFNTERVEENKFHDDESMPSDDEKD